MVCVFLNFFLWVGLLGQQIWTFSWLLLQIFLHKNWIKLCYQQQCVKNAVPAPLSFPGSQYFQEASVLSIQPFHLSQLPQLSSQVSLPSVSGVCYQSPHERGSLWLARVVTVPPQSQPSSFHWDSVFAQKLNSVVSRPCIFFFFNSSWESWQEGVPKVCVWRTNQGKPVDLTQILCCPPTPTCERWVHWRVWQIQKRAKGMHTWEHIIPIRSHSSTEVALGSGPLSLASGEALAVLSLELNIDLGKCSGAQRYFLRGKRTELNSWHELDYQEVKPIAVLRHQLQGHTKKECWIL